MGGFVNQFVNAAHIVEDGSNELTQKRNIAMPSLEAYLARVRSLMTIASLLAVTKT